MVCVDRHPGWVALPQRPIPAVKHVSQALLALAAQRLSADRSPRYLAAAALASARIVLRSGHSADEASPHERELVKVHI